MIKEGMYVRCPVDFEDDKFPRMFAVGQVSKVIEKYNQVIVEFHKNFQDSSSKVIYEHIPNEKQFLIDEVKHTIILEESKVIFNGFSVGKVVAKASDKEDYYNYYIEGNDRSIIKVSEQDIMVDFTRAKVNPINQIIDFEFHNPYWYKRRQVPSQSLHILRNFSRGFETLIGARAYLMSHQIDTIVRAISEEPCRFMLADEVGLGKTIEACVIMNGLKKDNKKFKTLIITPDSLSNQWKNELNLKFWIDSAIYEKEDDINGNIVILPLEKLISVSTGNLLAQDWNLVIIDESHRIIGMRYEYEKILFITEKIKNLLLLSATPIQERQDEYLSLLTLLNPSKYKEMSGNEFNLLYKKSSKIRDKVSRVYAEINEGFDKETAEDVMEDIEDIADIIKDKVFDRIIDKINLKSEDLGLSEIKLALAYVSQNYQIEKNIIRHRREEIKDKLSERSLSIINYELAGSETNFYERDTYEYLLEYLNYIKQNLSNSNQIFGDFSRVMLSAMFSSPWALLDILENRKKAIEDEKYKYIAISTILKSAAPRKEESRKLNIIQLMKPVEGEIEKLQELWDICNLWTNASKAEFYKLDELYDDPDLIKGRLLYILDYILQEDESSKYVLFTSWSKTLEHMEQLLENKFGKSAFAKFYSKMNDVELESNVLRFQNSKDCRFILCDELGGEGRNFQIADKVIHIDLPFSPIVLEQRIGRLDRIGRDTNKEVESVVIVSNDTVEEELFSLWNDGLNIFSESLSGMEIALEDVNNEVIKGLNTDISSGIKEALESIKKNSSKMKDLVARERHYDLARQLDLSAQRKFDDIINRFDKDGGNLLGDTMMDWAEASGWHAAPSDSYDSKEIVAFKPRNIAIKSMINTLFVIPNTADAIKRSKNSQIIEGTFNRDIAVKKESLVYFAPGEPIFESIMVNAQEGFRGQCCAMKQKKDYAKFNWKGFKLTWNVKFNLEKLIEANIDIREAVKAQGYLPIEQITTYHKIDGDDVDTTQIEEEIRNVHLFYHLGRRTGNCQYDERFNGTNKSNIECFMSQEPKDQWQKKVKIAFSSARKEAEVLTRSKIDTAKIKSDFQKILYGRKASSIYFQDNQMIVEAHKELNDTLLAVMEGIVSPKLELDSIAYIWMER